MNEEKEQAMGEDGERKNGEAKQEEAEEKDK